MRRQSVPLHVRFHITSLLDLSCALRADACGFGIDQVDCFFRLRGWRTRGSFFSRVLRAYACGFGILQIRRFFVLPDGTREDPRVGPSLDLPGPRGEEGAPSPPLDSTLTPSGITSCMIRKRCSISAKLCHFRITGAAPR